MSKQQRIIALDGLRGIAAFIVLLSHVLFGVFYPEAYFGSDKAAHSFADAFSESPFFVFVSGSFAVSVFFVLSGFVIAYASAKTSSSLMILIGRRYLRLATPIAMSVILAFFLFSLFPGLILLVSEDLQNGWLKNQSFESTNRLEIALWQGLYNCFRFGETEINFPLWSMQIELFGSILIYALYAFIKRKWILVFIPFVIAAIFILTNGKALYLLGFCFGLIIYEMWTRDLLYYSKWSWAYLGLGLTLGSVPIQTAVDSILTPFINVFAVLNKDAFPVITSIGAALLLIGVIKNKKAKWFLSTQPAQFLGKISFCLYLTHWPVMATIGFGLYLYFQPENFAFLIYIIFMIFVCLTVAYLTTRLVDQPTVKLLSLLKGPKIHAIPLFLGSCTFILGTAIYVNKVGFHFLTISVLLIGALSITTVLNYLFGLLKK